MKSRLFVVNEDTLEEAKRTGIAKIRIPIDYIKDETTGTIHKSPKKMFISSVNSMMADLLQLQEGDYVFFWCEKNEDSFKSTITGVYRIISKPYFIFDNPDDIAPFKVRIEEAYHFDNPITEYEVLNSPYVKIPLWNITGKKTSGKPRGSIQITTSEAMVLLSMLISKNPNYSFNPEDSTRYIPLPTILPTGEQIPESLSINLIRSGDKQKKPDMDHIDSYDIYEFVHLNKKRKLHNEKTLEGLFNQEIVNKNSSFFSQLNIDVDKIIWFGNYLPYSLDKTEMDYLIICSEDGINPSHAFVVEFKTGNLNEIGHDTHFYRAMLYSKWVNENLFNGSSLTKPIIICEECPVFASPADVQEQNVVDYYTNLEDEYDSFGIFPVEIYTVSFVNPSPIFIRKK